ncbi:MAG: ABC transporter permease, partial [Ferrovibrionaceae bacterium]
MGSLGLAFRYALRELRGGLKGFYVFLACLALGVAAIAGVASLSQGIDTSLSRDGRGLLGGDVEFRLIHRSASDEELAWLNAQGKVSTVLQMRAMAHAGDRRTLVEIKSADQAYPLYGSVQLDPPMPLADAFRDGGVAVDETLLGRLGIKVGDKLTVGDEALTVRARVVREADRATEGLTLGPRVLMATAALERTGLITPGSLIYYQYRLALPPDRLDSAVMNEAKTKFPDAGWRVRDWRNASPGLRQFFDRVGLFLVLVGLTALLVGGVGVGNATRAYLEGKTATIATLKCLGASGADIFRIYLVQILILALIGIMIGLGLGAALPVLLVRLIGDMMPIPVELGIYPRALGLALLYGLLIALAFALWPLARARDVAPAGLFRDLVAPARRWPRPVYLGAMLAALGLAATVA